MKYKILLFLIILTSFFFRLFDINWDQGFHLHPDERAITMFATPLKFPRNINEFISPESTWNPHFFAYGSFPFYLLKTAGNAASIISPLFSMYDKINLVGRLLSAVFDIGTLLIIFLIGRKLFNTKVGLLGAFFYGTCVFPIQLSHFFAVDSILTFFIFSTLYQSIRLYEKPTIIKSLLVGFFFGLSLATKISAVALISAICTVLIADFLLIFLRAPHHPRNWLPHVPQFLKRLLIDGLVVAAVTISTFVLFEPYAIIDFKDFWRQTIEQSQMTKDAFFFPYTLQYVGKIPYLYELKNIFLWGQGPILATISILGIFYAIFLIIKKQKEKKWAQEFILIIFFLSYFLIVGKFAVGWMRYMLPLYPILCLFGAALTYKINNILKTKIRSPFILNTLYLIFYTSILIWPFSFMHIYTQPNTRVLASEWIYKNIPLNSKIGREHWDDGLPLDGTRPYQILELPIYEIQDPLREKQIYQTARDADYIIVASNRLYAPLQKIAKNCQKWNLPQDKCYKNADKYYEKLFSGSLGYKKVAEFSIYPTIPFLNITINDQSADESFSVYDHPKVMIFQKIP